MAKKTSAAIIKTWSSIKKEVKGLGKSKSPVQDAQNILKKFVIQAEKDIKQVVAKDIPKLVVRFKKERKDLEKTVEKLVKTEIKKAQKFIKDQRKDLGRLQKKVESYLPKRKKVSKKKSKKKSTSRKKVTKKKAPATKKKSTKKKVTKKKA
jgi:hypothetical protein